MQILSLLLVNLLIKEGMFRNVYKGGNFMLEINLNMYHAVALAALQ